MRNHLSITAFALTACAAATAGALFSPFSASTAPAHPAATAPPASAASMAGDEFLPLAVLDWNDPLMDVALLQESGPADLPNARDPSGSHRDGAGDRRGGRGGNGDHPGRNPALTPELMQGCIDVASQIDPEMAGKLSQLREQDPAEFERIIRQSGRRLMAMALLKEREPQLYSIKITEMAQDAQVKRKAQELREAYKTNSQGQITTLEEQLRTLLRVQLAMSIKARAEYLCRLQEHADQVHKEIDALAANFPQTVEADFKALVGDWQPKPATGEPTPPE